MIKKPEVHEGDIYINSTHDRRYYSITKITGSLYIGDDINAAMPFLETVGQHVVVGERSKVRLVSLKNVGFDILVLHDSVLSVPDLANVDGDFRNGGKNITLPSGCKVKRGCTGNIKPFVAPPKIDYNKLNRITDNSAGIF